MLVYSITTRTSFDVILNIRRMISQKMKEVGKVLNNICGRLTPVFTLMLCCLHTWSCSNNTFCLHHLQNDIHQLSLFRQ